MALEKINKDNYVSILSSDGTLRMTVPEGTEGSIHREYETSDGKKGVKNELVFNKLSGKITNIAFHDGDFGKSIQVTVTDDAGDVVLSINTAQNYGEDFMKKLPNIDLEQPVTLSPYNFTDDKGKLRKGISILQNDVKVQNSYYDALAKKNTNKFPEPDGDTKKYDNDDWKTYFIKVRKFLIKEVETKIIPKFAAKAIEKF